MKNKIYLLMLFSILLISFCSASLGTFRQLECIDIKTILNTTSVNISTINYPNGSTVISNQLMDNLVEMTFNYTFCDTSNSAVPAEITARDRPTGGATISGGALLSPIIGTDETSDETYYGYFKRSGNALNTPYVYDGATTQKPITIREGEGITIQTGPLSGVDNVVVIVEGTLE